ESRVRSKPHARFGEGYGETRPLQSGKMRSVPTLQDVARILASTHEAMAASMRAAPPLDPEMAGAYQQGFADALRAVGVAFGVALPVQLPGSTAISRTIDVELGGGNSHAQSLRASGWNPRER
ncbi:MAG: hypothetical protein KKI08_20255, partial [Armatimonadetes bacterium]|nr:hypothetical protein [Armatimonadota bacterium]